MSENFEYGMVKVSDLTVNVIQADPTVKGKRKPQYTITLPEINGQPAREIDTTSRFWNSLCSRYSNFGINMQLFSSGLFTPKEVFDRLTDSVKDEATTMNRFTIQHNSDGASCLLGMVALEKPVVKYPDAMQLFSNSKLSSDEGAPTYTLGTVRSTHTPKLAESFHVGLDEFTPRIMFETPIDGYGKPMVYLSMLHKNSGALIVGYSPTFKSEISIGKDNNCLFSLTRALESFSNEEGFLAMRQRIEASTESWASVREYMDAYKMLMSLVTHCKVTAKPGSKLFTRTAADEGLADQALLFRAFHAMGGDVCGIYGIAHAEAMSRKKMERCPVKCKVWDIVSFCSEVSKDYVDANGAFTLQRHIGDLLGGGSEFDLEGTVKTCPEFQDFFGAVSGSELAGAT